MADRKEGRPALTEEQRRIVESTKGSMALEGMPLTDEEAKDIEDIATGRRTADEVIAEAVRRCTDPGGSR